jgi:hypothetical protein
LLGLHSLLLGGCRLLHDLLDLAAALLKLLVGLL